MTSFADGPLEIAFADPLLGTSDEDLLMVMPTDLPVPFTLTPETPSRTFRVGVHALVPGVAELTSAITATEAGGFTTEVTASQTVVVSPLEITVAFTPSEYVLNQTPDEKKTPRCLELEAANASVSNCFEVVVTIRNIGTEPVENLTLPGAEDLHSLVHSLDLENPGVPFTQVEFASPAGTPGAPEPFTLDP